MARMLVPDTVVRFCTMCGKEFDPGGLVVRDGDLCPECRKTYADMAFIYCNTCRKVVTRIAPGVSAGGFLVKPGDMLHVAECPICHPGIASSMPLEFRKK